MKKITLLLVIIFSFLFSTTSWGEWKFVSENVNGDKFYYDKDRVRKSGKYLYLWELFDSVKRSPTGDLSFTSYTQLDCSIFKVKRLKRQSYLNSMGEGGMTDEWTPPDEWKYPKPNSSLETLFNKVCEEQQ